MEKRDPFTYEFSTYENSYVYDVNTNEVLKVDKKASDILKSLHSCENNVQAASGNLVLNKMKSGGYLSSHRISEIVHPENELLEFNLNNKLNLLILQVTQQCNLRCKYCPYSGGYYNREHANRKMKFDVARQAIDFYIKHSIDKDSLSVGFYGGEPLLEIDLIKRCIDYVEQKGEGKAIFFNMTSNATLLTLDIVEYLQNHNVSLMVSLDGPEKVHDKNRDYCGGKGTFETVIRNLDAIRSEFPDYFKTISFNCVMDMENDFGCINNFFTTFDVIKESEIRFSSLNDDYAKDKKEINEEKYMVEYKYEIFKLFLSRIGKLDEKYVSKMVKDYYINLQTKIFEDRHRDIEREKGHPGGPCVPGTQRLFVDIYGNFYPCERVNESSEVMRIGNISDGFYVDKIRDILNIGKVTEKSCKNCWAYRFCYLCAAAADDLKTLSPERKSKRCLEVRNNISRMLKEYCILKENGDSFERIKLSEYI